MNKRTVTYTPNSNLVPDEILSAIHELFRNFAANRWEVQSLGVSMAKQASENNPLVVWALLQAVVDNHRGDDQLKREAQKVLDLVARHWKISAT